MYPTIVLQNEFERLLCVLRRLLRHIERLVRDIKHVSIEIESMDCLLMERETKK